MMTYVSFLRGINIGGRRIAMADLKETYEAAGMTNIVTFLQSGNVIFESNEADMAEVRRKLESAVSDRFGYPAKILVRTRQHLAPAVGAYPFDSSETLYQHYLIFISPELLEPLAREAQDPEVDQVQAGADVVYWKVLKGMTLKSTFAKNLTKSAYKEFHTVRNINTLRRMLAGN
jgi:uncharacterized protein (DUF1697 family)